MSRQALDIFASELDATVLQAIDIGARSGVEKRLATLTQDYGDPDALRRLAGQLRQHSLDHLDEYLTGAERRLKENGAQVHFAATTARALEIVLDIVRASGTRVVLPEPVGAVRTACPRPSAARRSGRTPPEIAATPWQSAQFLP